MGRKYKDAHILNRNILVLRNRKPCGCMARKTAKDMGIPLKRYHTIEYQNAHVRVDEFLKICDHYGINTLDEMKKIVTQLL